MKTVLLAAASALCLVALTDQAAIAAPAKPAASAAKTVAPPIVYKERMLANGLRVLTSVDRATPNVTVHVWYGVGSKDDPQGRSGFAHLFEHLMFKATKDMPDETLDRLTGDVGGYNNASTWDDLTNYYETIPAERLQQLIWAEAERLGSLQVTDEAFKSERDVVKEEFRLRVLAEPYGRFRRLLVPQASFTTHPYHRPGIGSIEELNAATIDDVRAFHSAYYRPDNATLIVIGNFDQKQLDGWIDQYFGPIAKPSTPIKRVTVVEPPRTAPKTVTGYGPQVPLPALMITYQAPAANSPDAPALNVAAGILSQGKSSRLYQDLVQTKQLAQSAFAGADLRQQPGLFQISATMASGKTLDEGEAALREEIARLRDTPVGAEELAIVKNQLVADQLGLIETIDGRANALGQAQLIEGAAARANTDLAALQAVTPADIQRVARKYLVDNKRVVVRYLPESARPSGEKKPAEPAPAPTSTAAKKTPSADERAAAEARLTAVLPPVGAPAHAELPKPTEMTLPNGLRVIVAHSSDLPLVTAELVVKGGTAADPAAKAGASSLAAGLLDEGTTTRSATQIASEIEALGGSLTGGSGSDNALLYMTVLKANADKGMAILADVAQHPAFNPADLERVRKHTLDNLQVALQRPATVASFALPQMLFAGSGYGHVGGGTPATLKALTRDDVVAAYGRDFRPDNATLILAGGLTPQEGFALAKAAFGDWKAPAAAATAAPAAPASTQPRVVVVDLPGSGQAAVNVVGRAIAYADPRFYTAEVTGAVLGGGYSSRLNTEIRIKRGLSYGASASVNERLTAGLYTLSAQTKNESADEVVGLMLTELQKLGETPVGAEELAARKSVLTGGFGRSMERGAGVAGRIASFVTYGVAPSEIAVYQSKIEAVTPAQVQAFAKDVFDPAKASVVIVGDAKLFGDGLKKRFPNLEVIPASEFDPDQPTLRKAH